MIHARLSAVVLLTLHTLQDEMHFMVPREGNLAAPYCPVQLGCVVLIYLCCAGARLEPKR